MRFRSVLACGLGRDINASLMFAGVVSLIISAGTV